MIMACEPMFEKALSFECVRDIIADVRAKSISVETIKKSLWTVGCGVEYFSPSMPPVIGSEEDLTIEELCDKLESAITIQSSEEPAKIDPATILVLVQLFWKIWKEWKK
jgi:hypothetical protein